MSSMPSDIPPQGDGRRYVHEIQHPKPIAKEIRQAVIKLLRNYHTKEQLHPSPSTASQTTGRTRSVSSTGTSQTDMTRVFSVSKFSTSNGSDQRGEEAKPLDPALRARKALTRKLGACDEGCRRRKVMCPLYHHRLRDLLEDDQLPEVEALVEWAIRLNGPRTETTPGPARVDLLSTEIIGPGHDKHEVMNQVDDVFELQTLDEPMQYELEIGESSDFLLATDPSSTSPGEMEEDASRTPVQRFAPLPRASTEAENSTPVQRFATLSRAPGQTESTGSYQYSTSILPGMFWIGEQIQIEFGDTTITYYEYACCGAPDCPPRFRTWRDLLAHYGREHCRFRELEGDPRRVVCPNPGCGEFYPDTTSFCHRCPGGRLVVMVFGQLLPAVPQIVLTPWETKTSSQSQFLESVQFPAFNTAHPKNGSSQNNWSKSEYPQNGRRFSGCTRTAVIHFKKTCLWCPSLLHLLQPLSRVMFRYPQLYGAIPSALVLLLLLNYETRELMMFNMFRLWTLLANMSYLGEPIVGVFIMVAGFVLIRGLHAHQSSSCHGRRCPLHYLKRLSVSCVRQGGGEADTEHGSPYNASMAHYNS